jgi:hypothetical protein
VNLEEMLRCTVAGIFFLMFKIPHMNKDRLKRINKLPVSIVVTPEAKNYPLTILVEWYYQ